MNENSNDLCIKAGEENNDNNLTEEQSAKNTSKNADSFGKFQSAKALLDAYTGLEAQFTKRSQEFRKLEKDYQDLKLQNDLLTQKVVNEEGSSKSVENETGSAEAESADGNGFAKDNGGEDEIAKEVALFLSKNPGANKYAKEIALKTSERGEVESGFLERAYIAVLQDLIAEEQNKITDDFIFNKAVETPAVKEKIIRAYLGEVANANEKFPLMGMQGQTVVMPPKKPLSIAEAGLMAEEVLKKR